MVIALGVFLLIVAWAMVVGLVAIIDDAETIREALLAVGILAGAALVGVVALVALVILGLDLIGVTP